MPNEMNIKEILRVLQSPTSTEEEIGAAMHSFKAQEPKIIRYLRDNFQENIFIDPREKEEGQDALYAKVKNAIAQQTPDEVDNRSVKIISLRFPFSRIAAVLILILGISSLLYFFRSDKNVVDRQPVAAIIASPSFDTISNRKNQIQDYVLSDGSTVKLYPDSYIYFEKGFARDKKIINIEGEGIFSVKKEEKRPFSVYSNGIEVRDLGTIFSVSTRHHNVKVKLIKGRVLIHSLDSNVHINDVAMIPNQVFTWHQEDNNYTLEMDIHGNKPVNNKRQLNDGKQKVPDISVLCFRYAINCKNMPLENVFNKINIQFRNIQISCNAKNIQDKSFTGTIDASSNLTETIDMICKMNGLTYKTRGNTVYIE